MTSTVPEVSDTPLPVVATVGVVVITVESEADTDRFPKVTLALNPVRARSLSVVSVAVYVMDSSVLSDTVKVAWPCALVVSDPVDAGWMVELPPP